MGKQKSVSMVLLNFILMKAVTNSEAFDAFDHEDVAGLLANRYSWFLQEKGEWHVRVRDW